MCSDLLQNFWLVTEEEISDLPYVARQELDEIAAHIEQGKLVEAEAHLEDLIQFSLKIEDYLVQSKIRLEIARSAICMQRLDIARMAVDFAVQILDDEEARRRREEATLIPIHNHYLAKSCLMLAGLEFRNNNNRSVVLANLQRCLDRLVSLSVYHRDHLLTPGNSYKIWADIVRNTISSYIEDDRQDPWGSIPVDDGCISSGVWWRPIPGAATGGGAAVSRPTSIGAEPSGAAASSETLSSSLITLEPGSLKNLPVMGEIAVGEYTEMEDPLASPKYSGAPMFKSPGGLVSLEDVSKFKIEKYFYQLYDLHSAGGSLELDPQRQYILLKIIKVDQHYRYIIQPGDYVLVRGQETARRDDLVFYWRREQNTYTGKLDKNSQKEITSMPYDMDTGIFEDIPDHDEVNIVTLIRGAVLGVFKRIP